jgi:predicted Zn-dependent protease
MLGFPSRGVFVFERGLCVDSIKPVHITCDQQVTNEQLQAIEQGVTEILRLANMRPRVEIRTTALTDPLPRVPKRHSVLSGSLDAYAILHGMIGESVAPPAPRYDVLVVSEDLHRRAENPNDHDLSVVGMTRQGRGCVISTYRLHHSGLRGRLALACLTTHVMHRLGHVFGLVSEYRPHAVSASSHRRHCHPEHRCIMRHSASIWDWARHTNDRVKYGAFCTACALDLQRHFS